MSVTLSMMGPPHRPETGNVGDRSEPISDPEFGDLAEKLDFLASGATWSDGFPVEAIETHMSWVFLGHDLALKIKKPVAHEFLDYRTVEFRRVDCEAEVLLNQTLAPGVYRGAAPLTRSPDGSFAIGGSGRIVDWLVVMRRLDRRRQLDRLCVDDGLTAEDVKPAAVRLARFYRDADVVEIDGDGYRAELHDRLARAKRVLSLPQLDLSQSTVDEVARRLDAHLNTGFRARQRAERVLDGHGDLRPEHVIMVEEPLVIDRLSFDRRLRLVDPVDELSGLHMECALLGSDLPIDAFLDPYQRLTGDRYAPTLPCLYAALRATIRAKLAIAHNLDRSPQRPEHWWKRANDYLDVALAKVHDL